MVCIVRTPAVCRNCGHEQGFNHVSGQRLPLDKAVAVCEECGFKSVWTEKAVKLNELTNHRL